MLVVVVSLPYIQTFYTPYLSTQTSKWGELGDYIGGVLNPIFGFLSFLMLIFTIKIQNSQLQLSRKELQLTREELSKSALAQDLSQKALNKQAEIASKSSDLNTVVFLLNKIDKDLQPYLGQRYPKGNPQGDIKNKLIEKKHYLESIIDRTYLDLTI